MDGWHFGEEQTCWRDIGRELICFDGYLDGERYVFAVSQIALNDYYETDDTLDDAENNYLNNYKHVESIATRFASEYEANDEPPHYFIDSDSFNEFA